MDHFRNATDSELDLLAECILNAATSYWREWYQHQFRQCHIMHTFAIAYSE